MRPVEGKEILNLEDQTTLRSGMGKYMYQMQYLRPEIAQAVCDLERYMMHGNLKILETMKRCMRFVLCSRKARVLVKPSQKWDGSNEHQFRIRGRSGSDYAEDTQTRRSVSGYIIYLEDASAMHRSATQKMMTLSSCKAELNAAVLCAQDIDMMYQKNTRESIGLKVELPMILEIYNKGAVDFLNSVSVGGCTGHINGKQCFLQELKEAKVLVVKWIPGTENEADIFTKNLDGPLFKCYAKQLLGKGAISGKGGNT